MTSLKQLVRLPAIYLWCLFVTAAITGERNLRLNTAWSLGDWLINYQGGFVRRGLWGAIFFSLAKLFHLRGPLVLPVLFGCLLYAILYVGVFMLVRSIRWNWWTVCLFISPATLSFPLLGVEFYKKEMVVFVGLVMFMGLLTARQRGLGVKDWHLSAYLLVFCVVAVLGHEPAIVYLLYLLPAATIAGMRWPRMARIAIVPAIGTAVALAAALTHPGDATTMRAICASFGAESQRLCHGGAVAYLSYTKAQARAEVLDSIRTYHYAVVYPLVTLLALIPFAGGFLSLWKRSKETAIVLLVTALTSSVPSIGLFLYATDWGRWIETGLFCVFLLMLFAENQPALRSGDAQPWKARPWAMALALIYATCWSMPGYNDYPLFGYVSMAKRWLKPNHLHGEIVAAGMVPMLHSVAAGPAGDGGDARRRQSDEARQ